MKRLTCEMCGSIDIIKEDGYFICQSCGVKYSVEEAKKMMIEGTVDVQGTVKVDNSSFVERYLQNARRAKQKEDWEETEKYYNMVEQNQPDNIEAIFYSAYGKAKQKLLEPDIYKRQSVFNSFKNSISIIDDNYKLENEDEGKKLIKQMSVDLNDMVYGDFVFDKSKESNGQLTRELFKGVVFAFLESVENIISKYPETEKEIICYYYDCIINTITNNKINTAMRVALNTSDLLQKYHEKWARVDPTHTIPEKQGCYVATAVYGSYDCPEVWVLRRYRDYTLAETWYGRLFIKTYYSISPTIVNVCGNKSWFTKMWKKHLDKMVANLTENGTEDTPYEDKQW